MKLLINSYKNYHVSIDTVREFEETILSSDKKDMEAIYSSNYLSSACFIVYRVSGKMRLKKTILFLMKLIGSLYRRDQISILMDCNIEQCLPYFLCRGNKSIYIFDAWHGNHKRIIELVEELEIKNLIVSSLQAKEMLSSYSCKCKFHWVPEGINPEEYQYHSYKKKEIDVLQLGRKYDLYHFLIVQLLEKLQKKYLYEEIKGQIIFPTRESFINGLAGTKISICFPSNIIHPERSGDIETMTIRYLQSIASKCLILGKAPKEIISLFGYNPVVEVDMNNPQEQLESILLNYNDYIPLIEKNYKNINNHTWEKRWEEIKKIIRS